MAGSLTIDTLNASSGPLLTNNGMTGIAKAWVNWTGGGTTINSSMNVSSITRNGTGDYTVNFSTAMSNANYAVSYATGFATTGGFLCNVAPFGVAPTTTALRVGAYTTASAIYDAPYNSVAVFSS